jgi:hypothetical protein
VSCSLGATINGGDAAPVEKKSAAGAVWLFL